MGEDEVQLTGILEQLWADFPIESTPTAPPEAWIDELADRTELQRRLVEMGVLVPAAQFDGSVTRKLTTKFVRDWRLKDYVNSSGDVVKRWMRRSRYVAREFANVRRLEKQLATEMKGDKSYEFVLGCLDVKDVFLH